MDISYGFDTPLAPQPCQSANHGPALGQLPSLPLGSLASVRRAGSGLPLALRGGKVRNRERAEGSEVLDCAFGSPECRYQYCYCVNGSYPFQPPSVQSRVLRCSCSSFLITTGNRSCGPKLNHRNSSARRRPGSATANDQHPRESVFIPIFPRAFMSILR